MRGFLLFVMTCAAAAAGAVGAQQTARGPEGQSGLIFTDSTSFWIDPPRGWVLDTEAGRRDGSIAVLYRQGESWPTGEPVIYASAFTPKSGFSAVIPAVVRGDSAQWAGQVSDLVYAVRDSIPTVSGAYAHLRAFQSASARRFDLAAYFQTDGRVWVLVMTARSAASRDAAYADFVSLVKSYAPGPAR